MSTGDVPAEPDPAEPLKLDANETPLRPPRWLRAAAREAAARADPGRYPDRSYISLRRAFAAAHGIDAAQVSVANGSGEALLNVFLASREQLRRAIWPWPTFGLYRRLARHAGYRVSELPATPGACPPATQLARLAGGEPVLCVIARPGNPAGELFPRRSLQALAETLPGGSQLVIDEAYAEFAGESLITWALQRGDTAVVRTLSKAYGMAGLRVGFAVAPAGLARRLEATRLPYPVDAISEHVARCALARRAEVEASARRVAAWRRRLAEALEQVPGLTVLRGHANFVLVRAGGADGPRLAALLEAQGVRARAYPDDAALRPWLRVSACAPQQTERVAAAFRAVAGGDARGRRAGDTSG